MAVTRHAATLDTEPLAKSYSGEILTHLSSNHFQYARAFFCYRKSYHDGQPHVCSGLGHGSKPAVVKQIVRKFFLSTGQAQVELGIK